MLNKNYIYKINLILFELTTFYANNRSITVFFSKSSVLIFRFRCKMLFINSLSPNCCTFLQTA